MKAYELIKETFSRRGYIWIVHIVWLALYGMFWWLFLPSGPEFGRFIFIWGGFFLPLALTAGIFGDDIASGRICVLVTKPGGRAMYPGRLPCIHPSFYYKEGQHRLSQLMAVCNMVVVQYGCGALNVAIRGSGTNL
jgi:hypothetical protein